MSTKITQSTIAAKRDFIGEFEITGGQIRICDPSIDGHAAMALVVAGQNGRWLVYVSERDGIRQLFAHHTDIAVDQIKPDADTQVAVDTGRYGLVDHAAAGSADDLLKVCNLSGPHFAALLPFGCVIGNGVGDGWFTALLMHRAGLVVAVWIGEKFDDEVDTDESATSAAEI